MYNWDIHQDKGEFKKILIQFYENGCLIEDDYYETKKHILTKGIAKSSSFKYLLTKPSVFSDVHSRCPNWKEG